MSDRLDQDGYAGRQPPQVRPVECLFPGATLVVCGTGPSLTENDCWRALQRHNHFGLAINDAYTLAHLATVLYAADQKWWRWRQQVVDTDLPPHCYTVDYFAPLYRPSVHLLKITGRDGLELAPDGLRSGGHSGYQAINLAAHLTGPGGRILLLGYDMQPSATGEHHFFGSHPDGTHVNYACRLGAFETLVEPLRQQNIEIINCTPNSALHAFPQRPLSTVL